MLQVRKADVAARIPPHVFFFVSAIFHYLGPAFAVLLFSNVSVLGVAWFRIASAAVVFAVWRRPWRIFRLCCKEKADLLEWRKKSERGPHHERSKPASLQMAPLPA